MFEVYADGGEQQYVIKKMDPSDRGKNRLCCLYLMRSICAKPENSMGSQALGVRIDPGKRNRTFPLAVPGSHQARSPPSRFWKPANASGKDLSGPESWRIVAKLRLKAEPLCPPLPLFHLTPSLRTRAGLGRDGSLFLYHPLNSPTPPLRCTKKSPPTSPCAEMCT